MNCKILFLIASSFLNTCAGDIEGDADCPRDCSNSINATPAMEFVTVSESVSFDCRGIPAGIETTHEAIFKVSSKGAGGDDEELPKAGIAIRPDVPNLCNITSQEGDSEDEYQCVKTPKEEWCSNECGLISIKFNVACFGDGVTRNTNIRVLSGGEVSPPLAITLQYEEEEEEEGGEE